MSTETVEDQVEREPVEPVTPGETSDPDVGDATDTTEPEVPSGGWLRRLPWLLVVLAVVLTGAGTWFLVDTHTLRDTDGAANHALLDTAATAEVNSAVTISLNKVFSYSYAKTEVTEQAAAIALRGKALETYRQLFAQVRQRAPEQKLVLTTRVVSSAVQSLNGDRAQLLMFLDQSATRADNNSTSTAASQLSVTAERQDGAWVIIEMTPR